MSGKGNCANRPVLSQVAQFSQPGHDLCRAQAGQQGHPVAKLGGRLETVFLGWTFLHGLFVVLVRRRFLPV